MADMTNETIETVEEVAAEAVTENVWDKFKAMMEEKTPITVQVGGIVKGGVIVYLDGVRGFVPASKLSLSYVENLEDYLNKEIEVQVITVEEENKRLVLSARELLLAKRREARKAEKAAKAAAIQVGTVMTGKVESLMPYGAFVKLENGLSGLVHVSQISDKRVKTPEDVLAVGDEVKVKVREVKDGKISLTMRNLEEKPAAEEERPERVVIPKSEKIGTGLGAILSGLDLNLKK